MAGVDCAACCLRAFSSSAVVQSLDQYLTMVPFDEISTMSSEWDIWLSCSKYTNPKASANSRRSPGAGIDPGWEALPPPSRPTALGACLRPHRQSTHPPRQRARLGGVVAASLGVEWHREPLAAALEAVAAREGQLRSVASLASDARRSGGREGAHRKGDLRPTAHALQLARRPGVFRHYLDLESSQLSTFSSQLTFDSRTS